MKRIALVIPTLDQGGAEKQLCLLADGLPRDQLETHVIVLTRSGPREDWLRQRNIPIHFIEKRGKFDPKAWWRLKRLFQSLRPDLVHTWLFAANAYGRSAAISAGVPIIVGSERSVDPWKSSWQFAIDRHLAKRTRRLTTNSTGVVDFYAQHGIPKEFFTVIPNAVTPPTAQPISREEAASRLGVPANRRWIMSVGRLWHQKGYKDLIWASEVIRAIREDTAYIIIGEGPERERLELYRDNVRAAADLYMVGERADVSQLLPHADVLWNGSLYEGQSNVILEAMQLGVPVLATDIPGNRDLIHDNETGRLYRLGDANSLVQMTNHILDDQALASQFASNARAMILRHHSIESMIENHVHTYQQWIESKV